MTSSTMSQNEVQKKHSIKEKLLSISKSATPKQKSTPKRLNRNASIQKKIISHKKQNQKKICNHLASASTTKNPHLLKSHKLKENLCTSPLKKKDDKRKKIEKKSEQDENSASVSQNGVQSVKALFQSQNMQTSNSSSNAKTMEKSLVKPDMKNISRKRKRVPYETNLNAKKKQKLVNTSINYEHRNTGATSFKNELDSPIRKRIRVEFIKDSQSEVSQLELHQQPNLNGDEVDCNVASQVQEVSTLNHIDSKFTSMNLSAPQTRAKQIETTTNFNNVKEHMKCDATANDQVFTPESLSLSDHEIISTRRMANVHLLSDSTMRTSWNELENSEGVNTSADSIFSQQHLQNASFANGESSGNEQQIDKQSIYISSEDMNANIEQTLPNDKLPSLRPLCHLHSVRTIGLNNDATPLSILAPECAYQKSLNESSASEISVSASTSPLVSPSNRQAPKESPSFFDTSTLMTPRKRQESKLPPLFVSPSIVSPSFVAVGTPRRQLGAVATPVNSHNAFSPSVGITSTSRIARNLEKSFSILNITYNDIDVDGDVFTDLPYRPLIMPYIEQLINWENPIKSIFVICCISIFWAFHTGIFGIIYSFDRLIVHVGIILIIIGFFQRLFFPTQKSKREKELEAQDYIIISMDVVEGLHMDVLIIFLMFYRYYLRLTAYTSYKESLKSFFKLIVFTFFHHRFGSINLIFLLSFYAFISTIQFREIEEKSNDS